MKFVSAFLISFFFVFGGWLMAQNGTIRGTVFEAKTGEAIPGVNVLLEGTTHGAMTDMDGKFSVSVPAGSYVLKASYISFNTLKVSDVKVSEGKVTVLDNLKLEEATLEISVVTVAAQQTRDTETAMVAMKKKSANLIDGISAVTFKKIGDSDAAASMKRVSGVSVTGGKYVFVRGLGDRYTKTLLNGMDVPGLDPDRNSIQMDIFPTNIIDNMVVHKSFSADLPADFTGGVIDIATRDFPDKRVASFSLSTAFNPGSHFNSGFLTCEGGKTDFLGFDDGTREIPAITNIPQFAEVVGNPDGDKGQRYQEILSRFNPTLAASTKTSLPDYSFGFTYGNQRPLKDMTLGYSFSMSYKKESEYFKEAVFARYGLSGDPSETEMEQREYQAGDYASENVFLSGMAGFAIKSQKSKYRLNILHLQNGESRAGIFDFVSTDQGTIFDGFQHNLDYSQRSLTNLLIDGKHQLSEAKWEIEWKFSPSYSTMEDPDIRFTRYVGKKGAWVIGTESGFPERIWRYLSEYNLNGVMHVTHEYRVRGEKSKLKFGSGYSYRERDFDIRNFTLNIRNVPLTGDPNELMMPANLWPMNGNITSGTTFETPFIPVNPNQFNASTSNASAYVLTEIRPMQKLNTVIGIRAEQYTQRYTGQDQLGVNVLDNDVVLESLDFFPSLNVIYSLTDNQNLRASVTRTIARPSFKELSYAEIYDPISGRTFIGGLFRDANDMAGIVYWDGNLKSTRILNYDLRWERFGNNGDAISFSAFYKQFTNPIEMVQFATQTGSYQPRNVGDAHVMGAELEFRQSLEFIADAWKRFSISSNITLIESKVKMSKTEYDSRVENARSGQTIEQYRDMAGQSPYIINAGIAYKAGEESKCKGLEAGLYYNVQGITLQYVGIADRPDVYAAPFQSLNFNSSYLFGKEKQFTLGVKVDNILNSVIESVYKSYQASDQVFSYLSRGRTFHLRWAWLF